MNKVIKIVTHHKYPDKAAKLMEEEGVVAIGWGIDATKNKTRSDIKHLFDKELNNYSPKEVSEVYQFRNDIQKGDIVFAYNKHNIIALIGEIEDGLYHYNTKNKVGSKEFGIGYPQQYKVKWWPKPKNFDRNQLPKDISSKLALMGTISIFNYNLPKLKKILKEIPDAEQNTHDIHEIVNEKDLQDYVEKFSQNIEKGLRIIKREYIIPQVGNVDFLAKDSKNHFVLIECKLIATYSAVGQLLSYITGYKEAKKQSFVRGVIIAKRFDTQCKMATRNQKIELYKLEIRPIFSKIN